MHEWEAGGLVFMIPIVAIIGGITSAIVATIMRARVRELEIRERIAMIEKGLVPPPEVDPRGFERALAHSERVQWTSQAGRHRRAGITLLGVGFGLMLIGVAGGAAEAGIGVGGFLVILGIAFFVNSLFELRQEPKGSRLNGTMASSNRTSTGNDSFPPT
jgi:hypothetical protein